MRPLAALSLGLMLALPAEARPVRQVTPDELDAAAEVVVNGRVESVKMTEERAELRQGKNIPLPVRTVEAKVTTLHASRGDPGPEFLIRFPQIDSERWDKPIINGPFQIGLVAGKPYRFYLKAKNGAFVGVMDGEFDDGAAVQPLAEGESARSAPLLKDEAVALATAEFHKVRPEAKIGTTMADFSPFGEPRWTVQFRSDPPLSYPSFTSEAEIFVDGARRILPASWIGTEKPRTAGKLAEADKNRPVRLTLEGHFSQKEFQPSAGSILELIGTIDRIGKHSVSGKFTCPACGIREPQSLSFPISALRSVQRLAGRE